MEIHFCDLCNESVPQVDLDTGRAVLRNGRVVCSQCEKAMSRDLGPVPAPKAPPAETSPLPAPVAVAAVAAEAPPPAPPPPAPREPAAPP
ncbi:MAG: hypothetical protein AB1726_04750, partial [Planctomycetota bacterium]